MRGALHQPNCYGHPGLLRLCSGDEKDKVRELCAKAVEDQDLELETVFSELQAAPVSTPKAQALRRQPPAGKRATINLGSWVFFDNHFLKQPQSAESGIKSLVFVARPAGQYFLGPVENCMTRFGNAPRQLAMVEFQNCAFVELSPSGS